ncbi:MAG: invasion associated locus B family protein [Brevundimonas sp.]|nr:invasion associated locus B family protein [Brevundimonas sp.]
MMGLVLLLGVILAGPALAQAPREAPAAQPSSRPEFTTAGFGDWILRCTQPEGRAKNCEIVQSLNVQGQVVAQFALGRPEAGQPLRLTLAIPPNVALDTPPRLVPNAAGNDARGVLDLAWRRCLPTVCLADLAPSDALLQQFRRQNENAQVRFVSGEGRENTLPMSLRGISAALDALAREMGR